MISVIIPCFNAEQTLMAAYESIQLDPSRFPEVALEILLVDDGSTDGTADLIKTIAEKDRGVTALFNDQNLGVSASRNKALRRARGEFVFFMDADDKLQPGGLQTLVASVSDDVDFVRAKHLLWNADTGAVSQNEGEERNFNEVYRIPISSMPQVTAVYSSWNALFRRSVIVDNSLSFSETLQLGEDRHFNMRFLMAARAATFLNAYTYLWRKDTPGARQATQILVKRPDQAFKSIRELASIMHDGWFAEHPRHRSYLCTAMIVEIGNFLVSFSRNLDNDDLSEDAQLYLAEAMELLDPDWVDLSIGCIKGKTAVFEPLYAQVANALGAPLDSAFFAKFQKTLSEIRIRINRGKMSTDASGQTGGVSPHAVVRACFQAARSRGAQEDRAFELQILSTANVVDRSFYRNLYPDVAQNGMDEVVHYLEFGAGELRDPNTWFNSARYFSDHPELMLLGINPLVHYIIHTPHPTNWSL